ncbi:hypothetical protein ACFWG7_16775 [Streptomyces koyangensis]|uniref:hypothetical protein n=1 Tax=Streptomyces koyangensis TaxID=188770 RepID=UPI0033984CB5
MTPPTVAATPSLGVSVRISVTRVRVARGGGAARAVLRHRAGRLAPRAAADAGGDRRRPRAVRHRLADGALTGFPGFDAAELAGVERGSAARLFPRLA